jgi:hypothetical protein
MGAAAPEPAAARPRAPGPASLQPAAASPMTINDTSSRPRIPPPRHAIDRVIIDTKELAGSRPIVPTT